MSDAPPKVQAPREKRFSRVVPPKGYTTAVLVDTAGIRDPGQELFARDAAAKRETIAATPGQDAEAQDHAGSKAGTNAAAAAAVNAADDDLRMVKLRTVHKTYDETDFEVSLMPQAVDMDMEERKLIARSPQSVLPEMLVPGEDFQDWALTKPMVQAEAAYGRFTVVQRGRIEIEDEEAHRRRAQGCWRRFRKRPVAPAEAFRVVRLEEGARPYRQSSCRLLYRQRRFADVDLDLLGPLLEAAYKSRPETLAGIVSQRLSPLCAAHLPKLWRLVALRFACLAALAVSPLLLYLVLGWTIVDVSSGRLIDMAICGALITVSLVPVRRYRHQKARYIRTCWQRFRARLDTELQVVNAELEALEAPDAPGRIRISPVLVWLGHDPYTSDRTSQVVTAITEADRFHRAKAILDDLEARIKTLEFKRHELETNGNTAGVDVIETFGDEKKMRKEANKQRKALAKLSRRRLLQANQSKVPRGSYLIVHRLNVSVELPGPKNPVLGLRPETLRLGTEDSPDGDLGTSTSQDNLAEACVRCRQITLYTRNVGLESIALNLCKSAREDAIAFDEYRLRKLLKLDPGADLRKALGAADPDEGAHRDPHIDPRSDPHSGVDDHPPDPSPARAAAAACCAVCQGPRAP